MPGVGFEPTRPLGAAEFKSATSTDSVTRAKWECALACPSAFPVPILAPIRRLGRGLVRLIAQRGSTQRAFLVAWPSDSITQGTGQSSGSTQGATRSPTGLALPARVSA